MDDYFLKVKGDKVLRDERLLIHRLAGEVFRCFGEHTVIVNIGVNAGASCHCLYAGAPQARHIAIDINLGRPLDAAHMLTEVEFVQADSNIYEFEGPVHLLFVDGCHRYDVANGDVVAWTPRIAIGGAIMFHDYAPALEDIAKLGHQIAGVRQAVDEWQARETNWDEAGRASSVIAFRRAW